MRKKNKNRDERHSKLKREMNGKEMARMEQTNERMKWTFWEREIRAFYRFDFGLALLRFAHCCSFCFLFVSFFLLCLVVLHLSFILKCEGKNAFPVHCIFSFFRLFSLFVCLNGSCSFIFVHEWFECIFLVYEPRCCCCCCSWCCGIFVGPFSNWVKCKLTTTKHTYTHAHSACFRLRIVHFIAWLLASLLLLLGSYLCRPIHAHQKIFF